MPCSPASDACEARIANAADDGDGRDGPGPLFGDPSRCTLPEVDVLPSGTVTFLFTDIEGSTRLLKELGRNRYAEVLGVHERLLRAAFAAHQGRVVDTQGDEFFVAFRTAADAVAAAVDAQRDLAAENWTDEVDVKVRMGLHTGEPRVGEQRYVGIGVHRAARIAAAGHGGQVLLSSTTRELAEEDLPPGVSVRDLGERRLKDIDQPQRLYQLDIDGLQNEFAQLNTLDVELRRKRRRMYAGSALIGVVAAAIAIPIFAFGQGGTGPSVTVGENAVAVIDPDSNRVTDEIDVGARPGSIAFGSGSIWVANRDDQTVSRIDPETRRVTKAFSVGDTPTGLAAVDGATWVVGSDGVSASVSARHIDPRFDTIDEKIRIDNVVPGGPGSAAAFGRDVWIAPSSGLLTQVDPRTGRITKKRDPNTNVTAVAVASDAIWVADSDAGTVTRIDPNGLGQPIAVGGYPSAIALGAGGVWVAKRGDNTVVRIDATTRAPTTTIDVGKAPVGIAFGMGSVWVANSGDGTVSRIDPKTNKVIKAIPVGESPQSIVAANRLIWVTVDRQTTGSIPVEGSGGTARISAEEGAIDTMDPALAYWPGSWQVLAATCAKLLNYPDKPAPEGSQLQPEVAQSLPTRSADGRTYTFTIRKGFRFSPPSGERVTAQTFKHAIERTLSPTMKSHAVEMGYLSDVVGAEAYISGKAPHISGIVVRGNTLTFHLSAPAPDLPSQLTMPFSCAVPLETPLDPKGVRVISSAGPYYVTSYTPEQSVVLERNPNYTGSRPHHLDRIELTIGVTQLKADAQIEAGTADYATSGVDPGDAPRLAARYGPGSPAAQNGRRRYFVNQLPQIRTIILNTHRPLFRDVRLRQAANYAIDRRALLGIPGDAQPTDQYLHPGMPGFKDVDIYPFTPDLAAARRLAGKQQRTATLYTCNRPVCGQLARIVTANLAAIGIDVVTKRFPFPALTTRIYRKDEPFDLAYPQAWAWDYPDPATNLADGHVLNSVPFTDPAYRRKARAASMLSGPQRFLAYGRLDADTARNAAPVVSVGTKITREFFSARMGCQVYQPIYGMDLAALCIRP
jgi:YVTN family beta-propeller protein